MKEQIVREGKRSTGGYPSRDWWFVQELIRCKDCKHRYGDECPMRHVEWVECEEDGYIEYDDVVHDHTMDDGYCSFGEREDGEEE